MGLQVSSISMEPPYGSQPMWLILIVIIFHESTTSTKHENESAEFVYVVLNSFIRHIYI